MARNVIEIMNLTKKYGDLKAVDNLSLSVAEGEFYGFIGPNGAGKSTTIRTLLGLISSTDGAAYVFGKSVEKANEYLKEIGYLSSEAIYYNSMTVKEIIDYSAKLRNIECKNVAKELCERLELDTSKKVRELSLGNRKKVGIVCAMQHNPKLYIMDEPTSGLDPLMQKVFFDLLKERREQGATIFFSSHVLSEIQNNCTRAAIIKSGRLIAEDSIDKLSKTNAKRITLCGVKELPNLNFIKNTELTDDGINFLYQGDIKELLMAVHAMPITDINITEPDLEEVFMHYYEKGDR